MTLDDLRLATDRWTNPILLKELRATFRGWWFLAVHTGFLAVLAVAVVIVILSFGDEGQVQPGRVGRWLHQIYVVGLGLAAVSILPSFASTAIVSEREQNTFEMLQATVLSSASVVRGKFLASMIYTSLFLVSSLPVWAVAFLYGGVGVGNLLAAFGLILVLSALSNIVSVFISACSRTSRVALMGTAFAGIFVGAAVPAFVANLPVEYQARAAALLGFDLEFTQWFYTVEAEPWMSFLYLLVVPLYVAGSFFAFSAVSAANRLKPRAENRSTNLKVFYVAFLYVGTALWWILIHQETIPSAWTRWAAMATLFGATGVMATLSAFFAAEEPVHALPEALRRRARWLLFQPLRPGSVNGFWFTLIVNAVLLAPSVVLASRFMTAFTGTGVSFALPLVGLALTILSFLFLTGSMGLFLSSLFRNERLRMGLQSAFASFLLFAPLVAYAVLHRFKELPFVSFADPGLLSPVVAFGSLTTGFFETVFPAAKDVVPVSVFPFEARMGGLAAPAFVPAVAFDLVFGALLLALGWRRLRRAAGEQESAGEGGGGAGAATAGDEAPHAEAERGSKE